MTITDGFLVQRASNAKSVYLSWLHDAFSKHCTRISPAKLLKCVKKLNKWALVTHICMRENAHYCSWSGLLPVWYKAIICHYDNLSLLWHHNGHDGISKHQPLDCLLNRLFRHRSKKTSKLRVIGLCEGNSSMTSEFHAQMASNVENVSIWWRHNGSLSSQQC